MRFTLKEYQAEAARKILATIARSRQDWHEHGDRSAFALSSTTGSGKTVIAATVIEALLHGSDSFGVDADPTAVLLWVSKDPALNEQTRSRFIECADRIAPSDLVVLDKAYAEESLEPATVYFINPAKLRSGAGFVRHTDTRQRTFWDILSNTVTDKSKTLYLILDEAHEGMRAAGDADQTLVQKIINGNGAAAAVPVVWGISATVKRFDVAMSNTKDRVQRPNIVISPKDVQDSGLLKNSLSLCIPDEDGDFETTMIRDATLDFVEVCDRWAEYGVREKLENPVLPLLVIQIPNRAGGERSTEKGRQAEDDIVHRALETVRKHWTDMPEGCAGHVLGDRATVEVGAYTIPRVAPQDVEHDHRLRVLVAKDAVSTGWDCPRAEVLVSLRPGRDDTYVTQLLGRMVRTPLARSTSEDRLNSASCYLPRFDRNTAKAVAEEIMGMREPASGPSGPAVPRVLLKPVTLSRNRAVRSGVGELIEGLPSFAKPTAVPRPVNRLLKASQAFAQDGLVPNADSVAHEALFDVLDGVAARHTYAVNSETKEILTADMRQILAERGRDEVWEKTLRHSADAATVEDHLRHLRRQFTTSVVNRYLSRNMQAFINEAVENGDDPASVDIKLVRARVAALGTLALPEGEGSVKEAVDDAADALTRLWLSTKESALDDLPDNRLAIYEEIRAMARAPERVPITLLSEERVDTVDTDRELLETAQKHVLADEHGEFPLDVKLNRWERAVIYQETKNDAVVGWYRNPSSASKHSLRIAYQDGDSWKSVQPDIIIVSQAATDGTLRPSIIDPHGAHLGDASAKLKALAKYADDHGDKFDRIIGVGLEKGGDLYGIDLKDSGIRKAVYEALGDTRTVKAIFEKHGRKYGSIPKSV